MFSRTSFPMRVRYRCLVGVVHSVLITDLYIMDRRVTAVSSLHSQYCAASGPTGGVGMAPKRTGVRTVVEGFRASVTRPHHPSARHNESCHCERAGGHMRC